MDCGDGRVAGARCESPADWAATEIGGNVECPRFLALDLSLNSPMFNHQIFGGIGNDELEGEKMSVDSELVQV